jgi:hypothetical protein
MTTEEIVLRVGLTYLAIFVIVNLGGYIYLKLFVAKKDKQHGPKQPSTLYRD